MEITKDSLLKIKSLITSNKKLDFNFYYNTIDILRKDILFKNAIKYKKEDSDVPAYVNSENETLYFSDSVIPYSENFYKYYISFPEYDDIEVFNYKFVSTLLHELAHLKQVDYANNDNGNILNLLYRKIYYEGERDEEHYKNNPYNYAFEYNADMEAIKISNFLFADNDFLKIVNYMDLVGLLTGYYYDYKTKSFLAERTFKLLNINDESIKKVYDLPIGVLIHNGLPVGEDVLDELYDDPAINLVKIRKKYNL